MINTTDIKEQDGDGDDEVLCKKVKVKEKSWDEDWVGGVPLTFSNPDPNEI